MVFMESQQKIPSCVGLVMDGNRRWAKEKGLRAAEGHFRGYLKLKEVLSWTREIGIKHLVVYAFSTENWQRSEEEVLALMDLFRLMIIKEGDDFIHDNGRIKFVGQREKFPEDLQKGMNDLEKRSAKGEFTLYVCLSYGGRAEILEAVSKMCAKKVPAKITEVEFQKYLWTNDMPDPDLVIRTGGEKRLSNFLPWQTVYSELFFPETYFPALTKKEFLSIMKEYGKREIRRGK